MGHGANFLDVFYDKINIIVGGVAAIFSVVLSQYSWLFLAFFVFNVLDYATGWMKSRYFQKENSTRGAKGIVKKVGYWVVIGLSFFISVFCVELGASIGQDLSFLHLVGYFTLCTYIVNEIRSILENLVEMEVELPPMIGKAVSFLSKGLQATAESWHANEERDRRREDKITLSEHKKED